MKSIDNWLPELRTAVSGADDAVIKQTIHAVLREFFTRGGGWKQELDPITLRLDRANYTINPQPQGVVLYPDQAWTTDPTIADDGRTPLHVYPSEQLALGGNWGNGIYKVDANTIGVVPAPNEAMDGKKLHIVALWRLLPGCTTVPDEVFDNWFDEILDGVKSKLFMMPSKPWTSTALGTFHGKRFNAGIGRFRAMMRKGYTTAEPAWSYPQTWR